VETIQDYIIKSGSGKGRLNQEALKSGRPKGSFRKWEPHPSVEGLFYLNWNSKRGYERWNTLDALQEQEAKKKIHCATSEYKEKKAKTDSLYMEKNREEVLAKKRARTKSPRGIALKKAWAENNREKTREADRNARKEGRRDHLTAKRLMKVAHINAWNETPKAKALKLSHKRKVRNKITSKYLSNPSNRLAHVFRNSLRKVLVCQDKRGSSLDYLGCTIEDFRERIESLWEEGMNWENYGRGGWHIDHITPCSWFDLTDDKQAKECFNWKNLQPMWETDNCTKKDRWAGDGQTTLISKS
jgi:hypothetical protein